MSYMPLDRSDCPPRATRPPRTTSTSLERRGFGCPSARCQLENRRARGDHEGAMPVRTVLPIFLIAALASCGAASHGPQDASAPGTDASHALVDSGLMVDSGPITDAGGLVGDDAGPPPPPPPLCGGHECASAEACCTQTGACYDLARPSDCTLTTPPPPASGTGTPCASNADCTPSQFCRVPSGLCVGAGWCFERAHPGIACSAGSLEVCACDGRTYASMCAAYEAGSSVSRSGLWGACGSASPAGVVACGRDADCPSGRVCCARTSICIDPACTACCAAPPPGTELGCGSDLDCRALGDPHGPSDYYCFGSGCGDTAGGCVRPGSDSWRRARAGLRLRRRHVHEHVLGAGCSHTRRARRHVRLSRAAPAWLSECGPVDVSIPSLTIEARSCPPPGL